LKLRNIFFLKCTCKSKLSSCQGEGQQGQLFDAECLKLINEYFYGVRIFPGQDPAHVYIGWVTTQYHIHDTAFDQSKVRSVIVQEYTEDGDVKSASVSTELVILTSRSISFNAYSSLK
jgi:hypothetical protein